MLDDAELLHSDLSVLVELVAKFSELCLKPIDRLLVVASVAKAFELGLDVTHAFIESIQHVFEIVDATSQEMEVVFGWSINGMNNLGQGSQLFGELLDVDGILLGVLLQLFDAIVQVADVRLGLLSQLLVVLLDLHQKLRMIFQHCILLSVSGFQGVNSAGQLMNGLSVVLRNFWRLSAAEHFNLRSEFVKLSSHGVPPVDHGLGQHDAIVRSWNLYCGLLDDWCWDVDVVDLVLHFGSESIQIGTVRLSFVQICNSSFESVLPDHEV